MEFNEFRDKLVDWMNERYESVNFSAHDVTKNNGLHLTGISGLAEGSNISPNIYINDLYDAYANEGMSFGAAATILEERYNMACKEIPENLTVDLFSYENVKDKLIARIVNRKLNWEELKDAPCKILTEDLVVTYRCLQSYDKAGIASSLIHNTEFNSWNISVDELHKVAIQNTERIFPAKMQSIVDSLINSMTQNMDPNLPDEAYEELIRQFKEEAKQLSAQGPQLYVLSNEININGAIAVLYPSTQQMISEQLGEDCYILPSSIHETIIATNVPPEDEKLLQEIVREANQTAVSMNDYLADSVYTLKDGELVNINQIGMQMDQAIEEAFEEMPESDLGFEL